MPTVCILLFTILIMVTVIPYAFSSVIKQLQAVQALQEEAEAAAAQDYAGNSTAVWGTLVVQIKGLAFIMLYFK